MNYTHQKYRLNAVLTGAGVSCADPVLLPCSIIIIIRSAVVSSDLSGVDRRGDCNGGRAKPMKLS